nr:hypothetical protein [Tanacetum cinerariifolium]
MTMHEVVHEMVVGECHEPNSKGLVSKSLGKKDGTPGTSTRGIHTTTSYVSENVDTIGQADRLVVVHHLLITQTTPNSMSGVNNYGVKREIAPL